MIQDNRDSLDLGTMNIPRLYGKILFPTLIGMVAAVVNTIIDGIFVGRGVGSYALASVNLIIPLYMIVSGMSMMFGVGASIVASVHLSHDKVKAANINITQAFSVASAIILVLTVLLLVFDRKVALLMGSTVSLLPYTTTYLKYIAPSFVFMVISSIGLFVIRLDGSPRYAMFCSLVPALINIALDYTFILIFGWGIKGAALATSIATVVGGVMAIVYMTRYSHLLKLYRIKLSIKSMYLTARNIGYQIKLGSSAMIGEMSVAVMMTTGNLAFMRMMGENGVAAFGVACYCYPIVFMIDTAVAMSAQPIISYNYGSHNRQRVIAVSKLMVLTGLICGIVATAAIALFSKEVASMFLSADTPAHDMAARGLPLFATEFIFFALNIALIGYLQSTEKAKLANEFSIMRGFVMPVVCFLVMPLLLKETGIWLSMAVSDFIMFVVIATVFLRMYLSSRSCACHQQCR